MKKLMSLLLAFVMLLTLCACAQDPALQSDPTQTEATQAATEETLPWWQEMLKDPNLVDYDKIDENVPEKGEYQIHTAEGLKNIYKYPDAKFKILRDIDLEGAEWTPVENFTGTLNGQTFKIKNFTISTPDANGNMALIGINEGTVMNLNLENVTITANESTVNVGALVAVNKGIVRRNGAEGTIVVEKAAEAFNVGGAVAVNENILETQASTLTIQCSAAGKGNIGGLVGVQQGGKFKDNVASGDITVTNGADKLIGLFCGKASDVEMTANGYAGASREVDGQLLEVFYGAGEAVANTGWSLRDAVVELPANVQAKRDKVVQAVMDMATIPWTVKEPLTLSVSCTCCSEYIFNPGVQYRGIPYNHNNGSLARFEECLTEDNVIADWCYESDTLDGWALYVGNDCSSGFQQALAVVCNDCELMRSRDQFPGLGYGTTIAVGGWDPMDLIKTGQKTKTTAAVVKANGEDFMLECYAQLRRGDGLGYVTNAGGHCMLVTTDPVVMRDENGKIDPDKSYIEEAEQVAGFAWQENNSYVSSWRLRRKYFTNLLEVGVLPLTWEELNTDEPLVTPQITVEDTVDGRFGLVLGTVTSNVNLDSVSMIITDDAGNEVLNHKMYTTADIGGSLKDEEEGLSQDRVIRKLPKTYDLANFASVVRNLEFVQGKTYTAQIIGHTNSGFDVVAREITF